MNSDRQPNIEITSELGENLELKDKTETPEETITEETKTTKTTPQKNKFLPLVGAIALLIGGVAIWRGVSNSERVVTETTENIEQARLTVKTVTAKTEPLQAWSYGDGVVRAVVKKHLNFQAEGTIEYIKQIDVPFALTKILPI